MYTVYVVAYACKGNQFVDSLPRYPCIFVGIPVYVVAYACKGNQFVDSLPRYPCIFVGIPVSSGEYDFSTLKQAMTATFLILYSLMSLCISAWTRRDL
jgi:hypothetical protein